MNQQEKQQELERTMRNLGAPQLFSEVQVTCKKCARVHKFPAMQWMEAIADLAIAVNCSCGAVVGICRKEDDLKFIPGTPRM